MGAASVAPPAAFDGDVDGIFAHMMMPAIMSAPAYSRNGTATPNSASVPPNTGPTMLPIMNIAPYSADTRPRMCLGAMRISKPIADTVNITDPMPPSERNTSSCQ